MRKWFFIGIASLAAWCCNREVDPGQDADVPEGRVGITLTFTAEQLPTKAALGEEFNLNTVNIAVFGGSGYLKEYQTITPTVKPDGTFECAISLALTNSKRRVHILGNGPSGIPFGRDYDVLPPLLSEEGGTGFWQIIELDNVMAKQDEEGNYIKPYVPTDELAAKFQNVALIRNWAKIELTANENSHFTPYSFAVVNAPTKGTIVPYGGEKGFITNYKDLTFKDLRGKEYDYTGNLPASKAEFDHTVPSEEDFKSFTNGVKQYKASVSPGEIKPAVYLYERPIPDGTLEPSYVIVYGKYINPNDTSLTEEEKENGVECYYKLDLMSAGEYYPILRNFRYTIQIELISAKGHGTPEEAAASAGSADVSADVNASHLPDISDGTRRMAIQYWMAHTFLKAEDFGDQLYVKFYDDINPGPGGEEPEPNMDPNSVYYELDPADAGIVKDGKVVILPPVGEDEQGKRPSNYGWRTIQFGIASPSEARARTQILRILCKTNKEDLPLYREIVISLLPVQTMRVRCLKDRILRTKGKEVRIDVDIPDGLVESMFPLEFSIEADKLTLTPDDSKSENVLPVVYGETIVDESGRQSFYFRRTVTWDEYSHLSSYLDLESETRWRTFSCYFKTNCDNSTTDVYVANDYFHTGKTHFDNYESFSDPKFSSSIPYSANAPVTVSASMMRQQDSYEKVFLDLKNLKPADESWQPETSGPFTGKYAYQPEAQEMNFNLVTEVEGGDVAVTLTTESGMYEPVTLIPWHFSNVNFVDALPMPKQSGKASNVAFGHVNYDKDKTVLFGFSTDLDNPMPMVRIVNNSGGLAIDNKYTKEGGADMSKEHGNNYTGEKNYFPIEVRTNKNSQSTESISLVLTSPGYVEETLEAGRFNGRIFTWNYSTNDLKTNWSTTKPWYEKKMTEGTWSCYFRLTFDQISSTGDDGIHLHAGGVYELTANVYNNSGEIHSTTESEMYCVIFEFAQNDENIPLRPSSILEPMFPEESLYYQFLGDDSHFIWTFPRDTKEATLRFKAPNSRDVVIKSVIGKAFRGELYD